MSQSLADRCVVVGVLRFPPVRYTRSAGVAPASRRLSRGRLALAPAANQVPRLYLKMRKNSSADLHGSRNRSDITATESAPASRTDAAFARVIPPIATRGLRVNCRARRTPSSPTTGSGLSLLDVENT